jgi:hypothetical protein
VVKFHTGGESPRVQYISYWIDSVKFWSRQLKSGREKEVLLFIL